jgi:hypothetical protein
LGRYKHHLYPWERLHSDWFNDRRVSGRRIVNRNIPDHLPRDFGSVRLLERRWSCFRSSYGVPLRLRERFSLWNRDGRHGDKLVYVFVCLDILSKFGD